jgi:hypothetical protein
LTSSCLSKSFWVFEQSSHPFPGDSQIVQTVRTRTRLLIDACFGRSRMLSHRSVDSRRLRHRHRAPRLATNTTHASELKGTQVLACILKSAIPGTNNDVCMILHDRNTSVRTLSGCEHMRELDPQHLGENNQAELDGYKECTRPLYREGPSALISTALTRKGHVIPTHPNQTWQHSVCFSLCLQSCCPRSVARVTRATISTSELIKHRGPPMQTLVRLYNGV